MGRFWFGRRGLVMAENTPDPFDLSSGMPEIEGSLRPKPKFADRISKRVLYVTFAFVGILVFIFVAALDSMEKKSTPEAVKAKNVANQVGKDDGALVPPDLLGTGGSVGGNGGVGDKPAQAGSLVPTISDMKEMFAPTPGPGAVAKPGVPASAPDGAQVAGVVPRMEGMIPKDESAGMSNAPLTPQQQALEKAKQDRLTRLAQARSGGLSAKSFEGEGPAAGASSPGVAALMAAAKNGMGAQGQPGAAQGQAAPLGDQDQKIQFLKDGAKEDHGYHPHLQLPAVSPNEVKVGSFIPLILETGINSDLPGQITARSSEAVYDSVTGCRELIPPMTKFVGRYDSKIALGQGRILVGWNSAIFKDGSELNLGSMQGYDSAGKAGLESEVDNHYWRLFGLTFGMSMVTAGIQLSVPQPPISASGAVAAPTSAQTIATALAQQYGQLGSQMMGKQMNVQPTLKNFPGERFVIMVPHTIVFTKVWSNRCGK